MYATLGGVVVSLEDPGGSRKADQREVSTSAGHCSVGDTSRFKRVRVEAGHPPEQMGRPHQVTKPVL